MESEQHHDGAAVSPIEEVAETLPHDSMVTVRLSEPAPLPALTVDTNVQSKEEIESAVSPLSNDNIEIEEDTTSVQTPDITLDDVQEEQEEEQEESPRITMMDPNGNEVESPMEPDRESRRGSDSTEASEAEEVNWEELEKTEENEPRNESSDDVSFLN